ncbi:hypothetical protein [Micromonospora sp. NBC_01813]|uniref:hypothetical protein n=1 Tax=Micromonospora sp. NBC_01813 TaxID=2975988 RepID=UPI002DDAC5E2|nr:hypothetical protein [Micromonospora sp. NBC_01813]WSA11569.1 hypothetical protein OG958_12740 [Micromonospora sp. NBC_01813]
MTDTPWQDTDGTLVASFKAGKGYEEPWLVIRGSSATVLRDRIVEAFDLENGDELSLVAAIHNASQQFHALGNLGRGLGGRVISSKSEDRATSAGDDPWIAAAANATNAEPEDPNQRLLDEIRAAQTVDQLKRFWVENNPLNEVVEAEWRARGKALKGGSV